MNLTISYIESLLLFWFKGKISIDQTFVSFENPNVILGIIPAGKKKKNIPINQISSVETNFKFRFGPLFLAVMFVMAGLTGLKEEDGFAVFIVALIFAAALLPAGLQNILTVRLTSGEEIKNEFVFFEKAKAVKAEEVINGVIANRYADTNVREQTDRVVDAINQK